MSKENPPHSSSLDQYDGYKWQAPSGCPLTRLQTFHSFVKFPQLKLDANKPGVLLTTVIPLAPTEFP